MTPLVLATRNQGKVREMRQLLADLPFEVRSLADYPEMPEVEENGATFAENAELKARAVAAHTGELALADDSGLVVDALGGEPGIHSARYGGPGATDADRNAKVLSQLAGVPEEQRTARFVAAVSLARPDGQVQTVQESCEGRITEAPRGTQGFGYDPIFLFPQYALTMAELPAQEKNAVSHRGKAVRRMREVLAGMA